MNGIENNSNYEIIDNEDKSISELLDKKEDLIALGILETVDNQISGYDIDLAKDTNTNEYYFIGNNTESLKIPTTIENLAQLGGILIKAFNTNIQLFGSLHTGRSIAEDTWKLDGFEKKIISSKESIYSKNDIEELFVFVMKTKGIPIKDWKLENTVCKGGVNNSCKEVLGNK